jgi:IclR family transcriptional regulator, acetate operon repressor
MDPGVRQRPVPQYPIEAVDRTLRLLALFRERPKLRLSEVREHLGIGQSTAHRLMAMLVYRGFAVQDPMSRIYRAGPELFDIGLAVVQGSDLRRTARPILEWLAAQSGETVHLGVLEGLSVRYVDVVESESMLRVAARVGRTTPAHATSMGKAMLATLDDRELLARYPEERLEQVTPRTMTKRGDLLAELATVRERGWAYNHEEMEPGVCSAGVSLLHPVRGLLGALSIAAPLTRLDETRKEDYAALLRAGAAKLVDALP